jgi:signal transduction histidine kinase
LVDVLNVSKLSAGLITLVTGEFAPWDEVRNTVRMFRDEVSARGLVLRLERDPSLDSLAVDRVKGDSGRFIQVVVNLLSNAIKFTESAMDHTVRVRIGALPAHPDAHFDVDGDGDHEVDKHVPAWPEMVDQEELLPMCRAALNASEKEKMASKLWIYVAVADSGHGMTREEQERVFKRFQQASPRTYGEFGGHGLGLVCIDIFLSTVY